MFKVSSLCKAERAFVSDSEIAREGKQLMLQLETKHSYMKRGRTNCLICGDMAAWLKKDYGPAIPYVDKIYIMVGKICLTDDQLCDKPDHPNFGMEVALLIEQLPKRFENMKVSYQHSHTCSKTQRLRNP